MFPKHTIIFIAFAVLGIQATSANNAAPADHSLEGIIDQAKEAIAKLQKLVADAIASAEQKLEKLEEFVKVKANEIISKATAEINEQIASIKQKIAELEEQASKMGIDVKDCVNENEDMLDALGRSALEKAMQCVTDEVNKAVGIIQDAIDNILHIKDEIVGLPDALKKCVDGDNTVKCILSLLSDIVKDTTSIPIMIKQKIYEVTKLISNIETDMAKCALDKVFELSKEAAEIGMEVAECVANKTNKAY